MDEGTLGQFEQILITRLNEIDRDIRSVLSTREDRGDAQDPMDEVDATANRSAWEARMKMHHRNCLSAFEICATLQRIRNGDFGTCGKCGDSIGLKRLQAYPTTTVCIECQKRAEAMRRLEAA